MSAPDLHPAHPGGPLGALVDAYPYKPYRHYRVLSRRAQSAVMRAEIAETAGHPDGFVIHVPGRGEAAAVVGRALGWETGFFGVPMGRLEYILGAGHDARRAALAEGLEALRTRGVRHVSARVDVADIEALGLLEDAGFRVMDALVTYTQRPGKEPANAVREVGTIRDARPEDAAELVAIAGEAFAGFRGRFHLDPHLPDDRSDALYVEWARQCAAMTMADTVLVSEGAQGRLLGFLAFRRREPVSGAGGVPVFGGGLGACRAEAPGAYPGLIRAGTIWAHAHGGVAECQTQNYNFPTVRIYEAVGAHYVRGEYTLHLWQG